MYYLVDTNVFLHSICDDIFTVANLCKENNQDVTITKTILNELEPGYYLEIVHSAEPSGLRCVSERTLCGA